MDTTDELRLICGHDSHDVDGCVTCEAATLIESLRQQLASRDAEVERYASTLLHVSKALCRELIAISEAAPAVTVLAATEPKP